MYGTGTTEVRSRDARRDEAKQLEYLGHRDLRTDLSEANSRHGATPRTQRLMGVLRSWAADDCPSPANREEEPVLSALLRQWWQPREQSRARRRADRRARTCPAGQRSNRATCADLTVARGQLTRLPPQRCTENGDTLYQSPRVGGLAEALGISTQGRSSLQAEFQENGAKKEKGGPPAAIRDARPGPGHRAILASF
jgi:hypothetical protein